MTSVLIVACSQVSAALVDLVAAGAAGQGAAVSRVDLLTGPLPPYVGHLAAKGSGPVVRRLAELVAAHDALILIVSEVHGAGHPQMVNALAWLGGGVRPLAGKVAALVVPALAGGTGLKAIAALTTALATHGVVVLPYPVALGEHLVKDGVLADKALEAKVREVGMTLATHAARLAGSATA